MTPRRPRKNPLRRTRQPLLPPAACSRKAHLLTAAAAEGRFALPRCGACGAYAWPMPEACPNCLSIDITAADAPSGAVLMSETRAEVPADPYFRERAPWRVGLVQMDAGPMALVHLHPAPVPRDRLRLTLMLDRAGQAVLYAGPENGGDMTIDRQWQEMVADPRGRRVLITDARHVAALPLAHKLAAAGAAEIFMGLPEDWKPLENRAEFAAVPGLRFVALDLSSDRSVEDLARAIGGKVEILINTADHPRPGGLSAPAAATHARMAMEVVAFGLMRLARVFGPVLAGRGADGDENAPGAVAWVNVLSVFARATAPEMAGYCAAHAAALSVSHSLRAQLAGGGVRLMTVLTAPTEDAWFQLAPQPKVTGKALAGAVVDGLMRGLEEVVAGDVARDLLARLADNPKAVERDLSQGKL
ncbi:MAG: putative short-chain dehydrogenase [Rhodobacteraceae bacterium HLUCCA12]|nr:MAG: putative short-chain dehydrogenase [Rhodobacteraceae bacterium HLUCCA12]